MIFPEMAVWLNWAVVLIVAGPLLVFMIEVSAGLPSFRPERQFAVGHSASSAVTILIPAHDEAQGIAATIAALSVVAPEGTRILVVADNCSDQTAALAAAAGADVATRNERLLRGKGYALAFGRDHIAAWGNQPDVLIVLDADCRLLAGSIEALVHEARLRDRPVQAINLIAPDLSVAPMVQISGFAMLVKNLYRSRGMQRLGGAALLSGTGMAFPWRQFAKADLATGSLVEDLQLGIAFTRAGLPPRLVEAAQVYSAPAALADALGQRRRWEHGFLQTLQSTAFPILVEGLRTRSRAKFLFGLHLIVPPLALLLLISAAVISFSGVLAVMGSSLVPGAALAALTMITIAITAIAWRAGGRSYLRASALVRAPLYVLWKMPLYFGFLRKRQVEWQRTPRRPDE